MRRVIYEVPIPNLAHAALVGSPGERPVPWVGWGWGWGAKYDQHLAIS